MSINDTYWFDNGLNYIPDHDEKEQIRQDIADLYDLRSAYPNLGGVITQRIERLEKQLGKCDKPVGRPPYWMSRDQFDPCQCLLAMGHEGECVCTHTILRGFAGSLEEE